MTTENRPANVYYYGAGWAAAMADQCAAAQRSIHISALSMIPPTQNATGDWPELWRTWCAAARRGLSVHIYLPSATTIHAATRGNNTAGRVIVANDMHIHLIKGNKLLHAKTVVIDDISVWIGSGNFTAAAAHHNHEAYLQTAHQQIARQLIERWGAIS